MHKATQALDDARTTIDNLINVVRRTAVIPFCDKHSLRFESSHGGWTFVATKSDGSDIHQDLVYFGDEGMALKNLLSDTLRGAAPRGLGTLINDYDPCNGMAKRTTAKIAYLVAQLALDTTKQTIAPFCDKHNVVFRSHNGAWGIYAPTGDGTEEEIHLDIDSSLKHLNTESFRKELEEVWFAVSQQLNGFIPHGLALHCSTYIPKQLRSFEASSIIYKGAQNTSAPTSRLVPHIISRCTGMPLHHARAAWAGRDGWPLHHAFYDSSSTIPACAHTVLNLRNQLQRVGVLFE